VLKTSVLEFPVGNVLNDHLCLQYEIADGLPDLPALPETLLSLEFQLQESSVDLRGFTETVLGDLGATIQILRLAGQEYEFAEDCPPRIEDCISDLGLNACLDAATRGTFAGGAHQRADFEIWTHSREIARHFRTLAEEIPGTVSPDQAYIAGLLHAIGALPLILEWQWEDMPGDRVFAALKLAELWRLPRYVKDFFGELLVPGYNPYWSEFLAAAHHRTRASWARCPVKEVSLRSLA
jgi:hypothetical protein